MARQIVQKQIIQIKRGPLEVLLRQQLMAVLQQQLHPILQLWVTMTMKGLVEITP